MSEIVYQIAYDNIMLRLIDEFFNKNGKAPTEAEEARMELSISEDELREEVERVILNWEGLYV